MVHHHEIIRQEFRFGEAVARDPGLVVGMALLIAPEFLVGVCVVGDVAFSQSHALVADVDRDVVGDEREWVHGAQRSEADVDDKALFCDGDDIDHVVPARVDGTRQRHILVSCQNCPRSTGAMTTVRSNVVSTYQPS